MKARLVNASVLVVGLAAAAPASSDSLPAFIVEGSVEAIEFDGKTLRDPRPGKDPPFRGYPNDLLSGGLNAGALQSSSPPPLADPLNPTPTELRRHALWTNFRAITDMTTAGGYGVFWGPALAPEFPGVAQGLIPGVEYKALMKTWSSGNLDNVPVAVQIPDNFDSDDPCVFLTAPSGSRGYYGGIAIGEWGLFKGCAVVLPGKATGTGFHLLGTDEVYDRDGGLTPAGEIGDKAQFVVNESRQLRDFIAQRPHRVATKHAHSKINPERLWGELALQGIDFAFWALNHQFDVNGERRFTPTNTLVIASGDSNGAGTALRALEKDSRGLIDGLVVTQPNINPNSAGKFVIRFGDNAFSGHGTSFFDNHTLMSVYAACAALSPSLANTPLNFDPNGAPAGSRANRCRALKAAGLLETASQDSQANEALQMLHHKGYYEEQEPLLAFHEWLNIWRSLNPTYAAAYGRFAVWENVCGISFAATNDDGIPSPVPRQTAAALFATSNGIPATSEINLVNDTAANGPILENLSKTGDGVADLNLDGARCFRYLATGDPSLPKGGASPQNRSQFRRVQQGIRQTLTTGDLHATPAMILTGRSDALVFPNYHSRPYYGLNQLVEGKDSRLSYVEVVNAQHFDALISNVLLVPGTEAVQFAPLRFYLFQALDLMLEFLKGERASLPPSQVVRPRPRGLKAYTASDAGSVLLPSIKHDPDHADRITFDGGVLNIPQ